MIKGYSDRLSARPGEQIQFMVSTDSATFDVSFVRLLSGDPDLKETVVAAPVVGRFPGRKQDLAAGSYGVVPDWSGKPLSGDFTLGAWIYPTLQKTKDQSVLSDRNEAGHGVEIGLTENGKLYLRCGTDRIVCEVPLPIHRWYFLTARRKGRTLDLRVRAHPRDFASIGAEVRCDDSTAPVPSDGPMYFATRLGGKNCFNGKIAGPCVFDIWLNHHKCEQIAQGFAGLDILDRAVAAWDFGEGISTQTVRDITGNGLDGVLHQLPVRSVTGPHWFGDTDNPADDPRAYAAIHFHQDSLSDAGWDKDFSLIVPKEWKSGVYAAKIAADDGVDYLPFAILPAKGTAIADIAVLMPTFTYLAYSCEMWEGPALTCLYDHYADGAGVPFASILRPLPNVRPYKGILKNTDGDPFSRHLNADLSLLDWLVTTGQSCDVVTDHDLHLEGVDLLAPYKVVITGSHPEYVSGRMLDGIEDYLQTGGSLMYLGGNGFYWVTDLSEDEAVIETRRPNGTRPWTSAPGEVRQQFSGQIGGLWRARGRAPQRLVGVGFAAQGWTRDNTCGMARPYEQSNVHNDPRFADLFAGIGENELIGDFRSLGLGDGAAGDEIDRADPELGTPPQAVVLGSATGFSVEYRRAIEEQCQVDSGSLGPDDKNIRSDIVWFDTGYGGAVFSTGSIIWISCLAYDACQNNVSKLTSNALARMLAAAT